MLTEQLLSDETEVYQWFSCAQIEIWLILAGHISIQQWQALIFWHKGDDAVKTGSLNEGAKLSFFSPSSLAPVQFC